MGTTRVLDAARLAETKGRMDLTINEMRTLASLLLMQSRKVLRPSYLEVGIFGGGTLYFLKEVVPGASFTGVDLFEEMQTGADNTHISGNFTKAAVQDLLGPDVRLLQGDSARVLPGLQEAFNLIFIDGNHTHDATWIDFRNAERLLAPGGVIALHNASASGEPDFETYNRVDGGPWQVATELKMGGKWRAIAEADRLIAFALAPV